MITDAQAEASVDYLRDSARRAAKARAEFGYLEAFTKVVEATLMRENKDESLGAQTAIARADSKYSSHLDAVRIAEEAFLYERFMREAAEAKFQAWRSEQATERLGKV